MGLARGGGRGGGAELREAAGTGFQAGHGAPGGRKHVRPKLSPWPKVLILQMRPQGSFLKTANLHQGLTKAEGKAGEATTIEDELPATSSLHLVPKAQPSCEELPWAVWSRKHTAWKCHSSRLFLSGQNEA